MMIKKILKRLKKERQYLIDYGVFLNWLRLIKVPTDQKKQKLILFAIISRFWIMDMVFYALMLRKSAYPVCLVVNKAIFKNRPFGKCLMRLLGAKIEVKFFNANHKIKLPNFIDELTKTSSINNVLYKLKNEKFNPEVHVQKKLYQYYVNQYLNTWDFCVKHESEFKNSQLIIPSGFIYESVAVFNFALKNKIKIKTVETYGFETAKRIIGTNEIAVGDFTNLKEVVFNPKIDTYIKNYMQFQENPIKNLEKEHGYLAYQKSNWEESNKEINALITNGLKNILLATTVTGDSSTIGVYSPFNTQSNWIKELMLFLKGKELNLIIRIHPIEARVKPQLNIANELNDFIQNHQITNVVLIKSDNPLNTFSIINKVSFVLTWVSTITADFVLRKKAVLIAAKAPFYNLGFCFYEDTKENYFMRIDELLKQNKEISKEQIINAKRYLYFLFQQRVFTIAKENGLGSYKNYNFDHTNIETTQFIEKLLV